MKRDAYLVTLIIGCIVALILDVTLLTVWISMKAMIEAGKILIMNGITPFAIFTAVCNFLLLAYCMLFIAVKRR